ncbi:FtsX-like permease family protein [Zoogloea sp.]|uniref:ABC transporter permease n=1 Tax=Zoogloea sp. TaxID=49181 RepID=UPI001AC8E422|nr:FtsX-like permease family protein [Zoogloea sp.]MBN8281786.1 ABC transporter permease [Zoogloea sp.]
MPITLALRNIFRQRLRSGVTLMAVAFGVVGLILAGGFIQDIFVQLGEAIIHSQTGHLQVFKKDFLDKGTRSPERFMIESPAELEARVSQIQGVDAVMGRMYFSGLLNNGKRDFAIIGEGLEADKEARLGTLVMITGGRHLKGTDTDGIMLGDGLARSLGLKPGDRVTLLANTAEGAMNTLDLQVIGVFQTFSKEYDARAVRIPLRAAQELLYSKGVNLLVVSLHETRDTERVLSLVETALDGSEFEVRSWRTISDYYDKAVQLYDRQFGVLQFIILLMVLLSVANSVNMSLFERQGEFGTMQALGNRRQDVVRLVIMESALLGLVGAALGVIVGVLLAIVVSAIGIPMPPPPNSNVGYTAMIRIVPLTVVVAFFIGFLATVMAAVLPARKISRIPIVDALRQNI